MEKIDIYDFDKTIFPFDSGSTFALYCLIHYPWTVICIVPIFFATILALVGIINFTGFKKVVFCFVPMIPLDKAVNKFWDKHEKEVNPYFKERKRDCVVISASPDFLLEEIVKRLNIKYLICTKHSKKNGAIIGLNCRNAEKVRRFNEELPNRIVVDVYSDSLRQDKNIFELATGDCYQIVKRQPIKFDFDEVYSKNK